jgi:hypothetical protein
MKDIWRDKTPLLKDKNYTIGQKSTKKSHHEIITSQC